MQPRIVTAAAATITFASSFAFVLASSQSATAPRGRAASLPSERTHLEKMASSEGSSVATWPAWAVTAAASAVQELV